MKYQDINAVNWSTLKHLRVSPLFYQWRLNNPQDETGFLRVGLAAHCLVLEPEKFDDEFAIFEGRRSGKKWEEFKILHHDRTIVTRSEFQQAMGVVTSVNQCPEARQHISGAVEKVLTWTDEETDILCKCRIDVQNDGLTELKSTSQLDPWEFAKLFYRLGYHGQTAFYEDGMRANGIEVRRDPAMIVVESTPPHDLIIYQIPEAVQEEGRKLYRGLLETLRDCRGNDSWPGIARGQEMVFDLPSWAYTDDTAMPTMGGKGLY